MRRKRRTVSETETHRVVTVRGRSMYAYCGGCGREVEMFTVDRAAEALGIGVASLCERVSYSGGHSVEVGGIFWVCATWLSQPL
jgi:hypothetical protein